MFPPDYECWDAAASMLADTMAFLDAKLRIDVQAESAAAALDRALEDYANRRRAESAAIDAPPPGPKTVEPHADPANTQPLQADRGDVCSQGR